MPRGRPSRALRSVRQAAPEVGPPRWSVVLRALREAAGATQAGWAARLEIGRSTLQRWEAGELPPSAEAESALQRVCAERGLLRTYYQGPLRGLTVSPDLLRDLLAEARSAAARGSLEAPHSPTPRAERLPRPRTSFVGRQRDLAEVARLLEVKGGLVTLVGPGGAGKTRLAVQVAASFPGDVWLVDLSAVVDPNLVARAVASVLGVVERRGESTRDALVSRFGDGRALLLLDNCEHLLAACAELVDGLLASCPSLSILATSRQALSVAGEQVWPMGGLDLPPLESDNWSTELLLGNDAVRLFAERASAVRPDFVLNEATQSAVVRICRQLDGLPLAIELAAARVGVLGAGQIASRLDDRLRLLKSDAVGTPRRHQTLRATLDWSHDLLDESERAALRRLSVFSGGWTLDAAETVLGTPEVTFDALSALVARSLVVADVQGDATRFRMLETVRQYGSEKLEISGEASTTRDRHLRWSLALAEQAEPHLRGAEQARWLERLEQELDNLRAALTWALSEGSRASAGLRLAAGLRWFWFTRGRPGEGRAWLERGLDVGRDAAPDVRARALDAAAALAHNQGDYVMARTLQGDAMRIWHAEGDRRAESAALSTLGIIAKSQGDHVEARALLEQSLALARAGSDTAVEATVLNNLAALAMDVGDYGRARALLHDSLVIKRALGDAAGIATSLHNLGDAAWHLGEYDAALEHLSESLALFRRLDAADRIGQTLHSLGMVSLRRGDLNTALTQLVESLLLFKRSGDGWGQALCMEGLAEAANASGRMQLAARLFGAAGHWRELNQAPLPPNDRADHARVVDAVRAALGDAGFAIAWAEGRSLGLSAADQIG